MGNTECPVHLSYDCCNRYVLKYSTDIAAVWQVLEKLGLVCIIGFNPEDRGGTWDCSFGLKLTEDNPTLVYADTAPEAICLAALKVKGIKK